MVDTHLVSYVSRPHLQVLQVVGYDGRHRDGDRVTTAVSVRNVRNRSPTEVARRRRRFPPKAVLDNRYPGPARKTRPEFERYCRPRQRSSSSYGSHRPAGRFEDGIFDKVRTPEKETKRRWKRTPRGLLSAPGKWVCG